MDRKIFKKLSGVFLMICLTSSIFSAYECGATTLKPSPENGTYRIKSVLRGKEAADIYHSKKENKTKAKSNIHSLGDADKFNFLYDGAGYYTIQSKYSGKMLESLYSTKKADNLVCERTDNGKDAQKWAVEKNDDGTYGIISKSNGLYMTVTNFSEANGGDIKCLRKNSGKAQKFKLAKCSKNLGKFRKIDNLFCGNMENFISKNTKENTVLLFEPNNYHHECLPGYAKYFLDLGYNVDVLILDEGVDSFCAFDKTDKLEIYGYKSNKEIFNNKLILRSILRKYKYVFLNTINSGAKRAFRCLNIFQLPNSIVVDHATDTPKDSGFDDLLRRKRVVTLGEVSHGTYINPHYFGQIPITSKNKKTNFVVVGNTWAKCRNYSQLLGAVQELSKKKLDFKITVFGRNASLDIPESIKEYFDFKGRVSYKQMYDEVKNADFILMLLDPESEDHLRYKTTRVTGNAQLVYGFNTPPVINKEFADFYHFNSENAIIDDNNLGYAMEKAINCPQDEYGTLQDNLKITSNEIFKKSLENLRSITQDNH